MHVEIYQSLDRHRARRRRSTAWHLPSEPWLFGVDGAGNVTGRASTARSATTEMKALLDKLVGRVAAERAPDASGQENDWPQPQVRCAFGLLIVNPAPWRPSL